MSRLGRRFHTPSLPTEAGEMLLPEQAARHVAILRLGVGDAVRLFDGHGRQASGHIVAIEGGSVRCLLQAPLPEPPAALQTTLVQVLPKAPKLDGIVRMATELDVQRILLATSERAVTQPRQARGAMQLARLERIAQQAARQCERSTVPILVAPQPLLEAAAQAPDDAWKVVFWEEADAPLAAPSPAPLHLVVVVGPEGGLSAGEVRGLQQVGYVAASLGPSLLRVETAAAVAVTLAQAKLGMR